MFNIWLIKSSYIKSNWSNILAQTYQKISTMLSSLHLIEPYKLSSGREFGESNLNINNKFDLNYLLAGK